jgi:hypothetical protein
MRRPHGDRFGAPKPPHVLLADLLADRHHDPLHFSGGTVCRQFPLASAARDR